MTRAQSASGKNSSAIARLLYRTLKGNPKSYAHMHTFPEWLKWFEKEMRTMARKIRGVS